MRHPVFLLFLFFSFIQNAQVGIEFCLVEDSVVLLPKRLNNTDSLSKLRFYISQLELRGKGKKRIVSKKEHYLIDFHKDSSSTRFIELKNMDENEVYELVFLLGVDTKTCSSGIGEGVLDPVNGMYWTWQSGYINFKLEGVSMKSPAKKNRFHLHLGGFRKPHVSSQKIKLGLQKPSSQIKICFDLKTFLENIDLNKQHNIMSPSKQSVALSRLAQSCFYVY